MKPVSIFQIRSRITDLHSSGGSWPMWVDGIGKIFTDINHIKSHIAQSARAYAPGEVYVVEYYINGEALTPLEMI